MGAANFRRGWMQPFRFRKYEQYRAPFAKGPNAFALRANSRGTCGRSRAADSRTPRAQNLGVCHSAKFRQSGNRAGSGNFNSERDHRMGTNGVTYHSAAANMEKIRPE